MRAPRQHIIFFPTILTKEGHLDEDCQGAGKADQESPMGLIPKAKTHYVVCKMILEKKAISSGDFLRKFDLWKELTVSETYQYLSDWRTQGV